MGEHRKREGNMKELDYIREINNAAKYCGKIKQKAYEESDYDKCDFYKKEQNKLYLLKSLSILYLEEIGILAKTQQQKDANGTILELYSTNDNQYNFHLISSKKEEGENIGEYISSGQARPISRYYTYIRNLIRMLPEKYKKIYDIITRFDFQFKAYSESEDALPLLKEYGISGTIRKSREVDYLWEYYYCDLHINDIQICKVTAIVEDGDGCLSDESGYLVFEDSH